MTAYLDEHPDAADRVAAYVHQRDALALLGRCLAEEPTSARLVGHERALVEAVRRRRRIRRTITAAAGATALAVVGWRGWMGLARLTSAAARA